MGGVRRDTPKDFAEQPTLQDGLVPTFHASGERMLCRCRSFSFFVPPKLRGLGAKFLHNVVRLSFTFIVNQIPSPVAVSRTVMKIFAEVRARAPFSPSASHP